MSAREFWREHPRRLIAMLDERKKAKRYEMQLLAYLINGGKLDDAEPERGIPGIDIPAGQDVQPWNMGK